jgi:hypothetical protein
LADAGSKPLSSAKVKPAARRTVAPLCEKDHIAIDAAPEAYAPVHDRVCGRSMQIASSQAANGNSRSDCMTPVRHHRERDYSRSFRTLRRG